MPRLNSPWLVRFGAVLGLCVLLLAPTGCYYMQAVRGHMDLMSRRVPLDEVIDDPGASAELKNRLALVREARRFASKTLLLPDNGSYRSYADLERDFVVWNVFAAPEFSLEPRTWCYPVAGCVAYRGYFREEAARKMVRKLAEDGFDVAVGGVAAYSTLGRFDDPLLNTMMRWSDAELVATMFHELAHQKLYVKGDSAFNESFATAVAEEGLGRWLTYRGEPAALDDYRRRRVLQQAIQARVQEAREALSQVFESNVSAAAMREQKATILESLSADAEDLIAASQTGAGNWLAAPLNNARLVSVNLYEGQVAAFRALLRACSGELQCFYERVEALARLPEAERQIRMAAPTVSP